MATVESELQLLEEFHRSASEKDGEAQASVIRNGYLPETPQALVEAGVRCIPLIEASSPVLVDAGTDRLTAIIFKLKMVQKSVDTISAIEKFESIIEKEKADANKDTFYGLLLIGGLIILIFAAVYFILKLFVK